MSASCAFILQWVYRGRLHMQGTRLLYCVNKMQNQLLKPRLTTIGRCFSTSPPVEKVKTICAVESSRRVQVNWSDGSLSLYPFVWMRDNCQCPECFHPVSLSRTVNLKNLDINVAPQSIQNGDTVQIVWSDGHSSTYTADWLKRHSFNPDHHKFDKKPAERRLRLLWGSELMKEFPTADYSEILSNDGALLDFLCDWHAYGFVRIVHAGKEKGAMRKIIERVSFIRKTHYGEEFFVAAKGDPSNVAYTSGPLQLHTDLPYYVYKPGAEFLHCLCQHVGEGGQSLFVDGYNGARILKKEHPDAYKLLTTVDVNWTDIGTEDGLSFHKTSSFPVICLNSLGEPCRINFSQPQRDSHFPVSLELVEPWYQALKLFHDILTDPSNLLTFKMKEGEMIAFDNLRILHGRIGFSGASERLLEGAYIDWDEIYSRIRVLENARC